MWQHKYTAMNRSEFDSQDDDNLLFPTTDIPYAFLKLLMCLLGRRYRRILWHLDHIMAISEKEQEYTKESISIMTYIGELEKLRIM